MADNDPKGDVHANGEIWSRALYDINQGLGRDEANIIILEAQFQFAPDTSFEAAAQATVGTAQRLSGRAPRRYAAEPFEARGIL